MADGTVYGLIGALGGAGITGIVAYFAPVRLHRLQADERRHQDERDEAKAEAARLAKDASDKEQEQAKRLAQDLQTLADYTVSSGLWVDALVLAATDLKNGREVEIARFDDSIAELRQRVRKLRTMPTPDAVAVQTGDVHALFAVNTTAREALITGNSGQLNEAITDFRKYRLSITDKLKAEISAKWNITLGSY